MASSPPDMPQSPYLGEGSPILDFKQVGDESLKGAWDGFLEIQARANPKSCIKLLLRSFYVGLSLSHRCVLVSMFEKDFLGNNAFDTYDKMKNIFGEPKIKTIALAILVCHRQTELIKEARTSMESNFRGLFNSISKIHGNIMQNNRRLDTIEQKLDVLCARENKIVKGSRSLMDKDDNT